MRLFSGKSLTKTCLLQLNITLIFSMTKNEMIIALETLRTKKSRAKDFIEQMNIADEIHNIEMKLNGVKPTDSSIDCIGCGS